MKEKTDRRIRKTKAQLRAGLAKLMQEKSIKEITVKELVEEVDINRSTFYLHYTDIFNMLSTIEEELLEEIRQTIQNHPVSPFNESSFPFIEDIFHILAKNKDICNALLGPNGDIAFIHRIENLISTHSLNVLRRTFPDTIEDLKYSYSFCLSGCIGLVKTWLTSDTDETPQYMAQLTFRLIMNALRHMYPDNTPSQTPLSGSKKPSAGIDPTDTSSGSVSDRDFYCFSRAF